MGPDTCYFDGQCGLCRRTTRLLRRLDWLGNLRFRDMTRLLESLGFTLARVSGSHHIFTHPNIRELVNVPEVAGKCKPYQVRQVLALIDRYNLSTR